MKYLKLFEEHLYGDVIGQTKKGKDIFSHKNPEDYQDYEKDDHIDAGDKHEEISDKYFKKNYSKSDDKSKHHMRMANAHDRFLKNNLKVNSDKKDGPWGDKGSRPI